MNCNFQAGKCLWRRTRVGAWPVDRGGDVSWAPEETQGPIYPATGIIPTVPVNSFPKAGAGQLVCLN